MFFVDFTSQDFEGTICRYRGRDKENSLTGRWKLPKGFMNNDTAIVVVPSLGPQIQSASTRPVAWNERVREEPTRLFITKYLDEVFGERRNILAINIRVPHLIFELRYGPNAARSGFAWQTYAKADDTAWY